MRYRFKLTRPLTARGALLVVATLAAGGAVSQTIPKEGKFDVTNCSVSASTVIQFSKTLTANTTELVGNTRSNPPGGPFDLTTFRCLTISLTIDGKSSGSFYCESIDKDGDKWMSRATSEGPTSKLDAIAGTGKYEGMVRSGTSESLGAFPAIKPGTSTACSRQTGTYRLK
jgi:hypothetical protein